MGGREEVEVNGRTKTGANSCFVETQVFAWLCNYNFTHALPATYNWIGLKNLLGCAIVL